MTINSAPPGYSPLDFFMQIYKFNDICKTFEGDALEKIKLYAKLVQEEAKELQEAIDAGDIAEVSKELADVLVTSFGLHQVLEGLADVKQTDACYIVGENNLTKFIDLAEVDEKGYQKIVDDTKELYAAKGIEVEVEENEEYGVAVFKNKATGKVVKPSTYQKVDLTGLMTEAQLNLFKE